MLVSLVGIAAGGTCVFRVLVKTVAETAVHGAVPDGNCG